MKLRTGIVGGGTVSAVHIDGLKRNPRTDLVAICDVDEERATILDTISVERGYTRRASDHVRYVAAPEDLDSIVEQTRQFLESHDGKRRVSLDSITEMIYYSDVERTHEAVESILELLDEHDAVGLFHLAKGVHEDDVIDDFASLFDGVVDLAEDNSVSAEF